jgi:hypothetical protein
MGSGSFQGKTVFSGVLWGILEFWSGWRVLAQNIGVLVKFGNFSGIFVDFWNVWSGLGPFCKYFSEAEGPAVSFPNAQGQRHNFQQSQGAPYKIVGIYRIRELFFNGKICGPGPRHCGPSARPSPR